MGWRRIFETDPVCHSHGHGKLLPGIGFGIAPAKPALSAAGSSGCDVHHKKTLCTCKELLTRNRAVEIAKQGAAINSAADHECGHTAPFIKGKPTKQF